MSVEKMNPIILVDDTVKIAKKSNTGLIILVVILLVVVGIYIYRTVKAKQNESGKRHTRTTP